jgi:NADH:ubiquinone oxidoreductase subunit 3 (subunit A)
MTEILFYFVLAIGGGVLAAVLAILAVIAMVAVAATVAVYLPAALGFLRKTGRKSKALESGGRLASSAWSSETA